MFRRNEGGSAIVVSFLRPRSLIGAVSFPAACRYDSAMIVDAVDAFAQIFTPPFRATLLKSLDLTIALLVVIWLGHALPTVKSAT
jgi:hypothetical protein